MDDGLLAQYLPADYCDTFRKDISGENEITPDELLRKVFTNFPRWVGMLLKLRNVMMKPFGLETGSFEDHLSDMIKCRSDREIVIGMDDKHLAFYVSLRCSPKENEQQNISVTTIVKYNNMLGRVYFFFVRPFHKLILRSIVKTI